eukprot:1226510-Pyramimonas_sp.AAC.1
MLPADWASSCQCVGCPRASSVMLRKISPQIPPPALPARHEEARARAEPAWRRAASELLTSS